MNVKAIIASLVLGSSSAAMAAPAVTVSVNASASYGAPVVRDHRAVVTADDCAPAAPAPIYSRPVAQPVYTRPVAQPVYQSPPIWRQPVTLGTNLRFDDAGRSLITVARENKMLASLQISASAGRTFVKQVYVEYDNGQKQMISNLNTTLSGNQKLNVDLDGNRRGVVRVVVYGNTINGWQRGPSGLTVIGL